MNEIRYIIQNKIIKKFQILLNTTNNEKKKIISNKILDYFDSIYVKLNKLTKDKNDIINAKSYINIAKDDMQKYYINKIINKCDNKKIRRYLIIFLENNYGNIMFNLNITINNIKDILENIESSSYDDINKIYGYMEFVEESIIDLYCLFIDCYLLRRVLDKNYINKSIIYTGIQHSIHYIYFPNEIF